MIVYQTAPTEDGDGVEQVLVNDNNTRYLLYNILKELKKSNLHYAIMNDTIIEDTEVEL